MAQAAALAQRLRHWEIDAIYSSDLQRASVTAAAVAAVKNLPVHTDPVWRERDVGDHAGKTYEEIRRELDAPPGSFLQPNLGETMQQVQDRVVAAYQQLLTKHTTGTIAIFAHGGLIAMLIAYLLDVPVDQNRQFSVGKNTGISVVEVNDGKGRVMQLNDAAHLEPAAQF